MTTVLHVLGLSYQLYLIELRLFGNCARDLYVSGRKMKDLEERDRIRNFQPPITGEVIMQTYGIGPCRAIGDIKEVIKNAILDGEIPNDYDAAYALMERLAAEKGLTKAAARNP